MIIQHNFVSLLTYDVLYATFFVWNKEVIRLTINNQKEKKKEETIMFSGGMVSGPLLIGILFLPLWYCCC